MPNSYLPMKNEAWALTPNLWWRFLSDRPAIQTPLQISLRPLATRLNVHASENLLSEAELEWTQSEITMRKTLQERPMECMMWGNLHQVKLLQFVEPKMKVTILIKVTQERMGIIKHSISLFKGEMTMKKELMEAWRWRDIEDKSSSSHFDSATNPYPIMNALVWNCRGEMKPFFRKTVMDLVDWHNPIVMVIT